MQRKFFALAALLFMATAAPAFAQEVDSGDTAWMLTATALVLFMTIPGLSLFYGGLVRSKNVLSVLMQCFSITALVSILWAVYGYSLAFDTTGMVAGTTNFHSFIGGLSNLFLRNVTVDAVTGTIPESVFCVFQLTFAIITPALVAGAFAERMKFSAVLLFTVFWFTLVYVPICHMVWAGDGALMANWGVFDFAGGTVVHINAGIAALIAAVLVGKRQGYPALQMPPHNLPLTVVGAGMLWVGWFGFNAGSAVAANASAGMAMLVTHLATAAAALTWMLIEWLRHGKPSVLGIVTGAVAGLVAITPAAGVVGPMGAIVIGVVSGGLCLVMATSVKHVFGYDDSLDAFGVHGIGGIVGALLTGVFASTMLGGQEDINIGSQFVVQAMGVGFTLVYGGVLSFAILKGIDLTLGLRVDETEEEQGIDLVTHGEQGYNV